MQTKQENRTCLENIKNFFPQRHIGNKIDDQLHGLEQRVMQSQDSHAKCDSTN